MKEKRISTIVTLAMGLMVWSAQFAGAAPMGAAFTYQGRLIDANEPADGLYDLEFRLYDEVTSGTQQGSTVTVTDLDVVDGYFNVQLDFGSDVFNGDARWLEIAVRAGELEEPNIYTVLSLRQQVMLTPYALYAKTAANDGDWMVSGNNMYQIPSGNVGIGTTGPIRKFHVEGQAYIKDALGIRTTVNYPFETALQIGDLVDPDACKNSPVVSIRECGGACGGLYVYADRFWSGYFGGGDFIIDGGNVGIGTKNPKTKLEIIGSMKAAVSNPGHNAVSAFFTNSSDVVDSAVSIDLGIGTAAPSEWRIKATHNSLEMGNAVFPAPAITIDNSHHVAINNGLSVGSGGDVAIHAASGTVPLILITGKHGVVTLGEGYGIYARGGQKAGYFEGDVYVSEKIGIGTTDPKQKLHVAGLARFDLGDGRIEMSTPGGWPGVISYSPAGHRRDIIVDELGLRVLTSATSAAPSAENGITIREDGSVGIGTSYPGAYKMAVNGSAAKPGGGSWSNFSDMRLKNLNGSYERGLPEISRLNPVRYSYRENNELGLPADEEYVGVTAQEVQSVIPEAIEENDKGYLMVNNDPIIWAMANAIKELAGQNQQLREQNQEIRRRLEALEKCMQQSQFQVVKEVQQ